MKGANNEDEEEADECKEQLLSPFHPGLWGDVGL